MDWTLFARYAGPSCGVLLGFFLTRYFEKRPIVVTYLWNTSAVRVRLSDGSESSVHGHSFVVMNLGKVAAENVRLGHNTLPDFSVYPPVPFEILDLPGGSREIVFPRLVPRELVTIAYIYSPPTLWSHVNTYTKSDAGYAESHNVLPTRQLAPWVTRSAQALIWIGAITVLAALSELGLFLVRHFQSAP